MNRLNIVYNMMKKKIFPLEIATENGEYIIPTEYYNNAISKESEETA